MSGRGNINVIIDQITHKVQAIKFDLCDHPNSKCKRANVKNVSEHLECNMQQERKPAGDDSNRYCTDREENDKCQRRHNSMCEAVCYRVVDVEWEETRVR